MTLVNPQQPSVGLLRLAVVLQPRVGHRQVVHGVEIMLIQSEDALVYVDGAVVPPGGHEGFAERLEECDIVWVEPGGLGKGRRRGFAVAVGQGALACQEGPRGLLAEDGQQLRPARQLPLGEGRGGSGHALFVVGGRRADVGSRWSARVPGGGGVISLRAV